MQIEVKIEKGISETRVVVYAESMSEEVNALLKRISQDTPKLTVGFINDRAEVLKPEAIYRLYSEKGRVFARTHDETYVLRGPLYEWELRLSGDGFVRISQSELIAISKIKAFDLNLAGTICILLTDGTVTYASRRYVTKLKTILGL